MVAPLSLSLERLEGDEGLVTPRGISTGGADMVGRDTHLGVRAQHGTQTRRGSCLGRFLNFFSVLIFETGSH